MKASIMIHTLCLITTLLALILCSSCSDCISFKDEYIKIYMLENHDLNHDFCISKAEASMVKSIKRNAFDMSKEFDDSYRNKSSLMEFEDRTGSEYQVIRDKHKDEFEKLYRDMNIPVTNDGGIYIGNMTPEEMRVYHEEGRKISLAAYREHKDDLRKVLEEGMELLENLSLPCPQTLDDLNKFTNLRIIEEGAFRGCLKIEKINLEYIEQIDDEAFGMMLVKEVKLPNVSKIGNAALPRATRNIILTSPKDFIAPNAMFVPEFTIFVSLTLNENKKNEISNNSWRGGVWESINLK